MHDIKVGTMVGGYDSPELIRKIKQYGFETFAISFSKTVFDGNLKELANAVNESIADTEAAVSSIAVYGNPLLENEEGEITINSFKELIKNAKGFGCDIVAGFAGGLTGQSIDDSIPRFKEVFSELARLAESEGVRIAFENCPMKGSWNNITTNIAINPKAWEMMFNAVPFDNIGLQWEPAHQMGQLIEPLPQLRKWTPKIFNVHGKDAVIAHDIIREHGILGTEQWFWHRTPGFGDCNWTDVISLLRMYGFKGSIDIEGWHDPVYKGELEYTGQVSALRYLKMCRGGEYVVI